MPKKNPEEIKTRIDKIEKKVDDRDKVINDAMAKLNKQFGSGAVVRIGDLENSDIKTEFVSTGSYGLDYVMGGGFAKRRITEISGMQSSGKTALALQFIARVQKEGMKCAFVDVEYSFDTSFAKMIGVDTDALIYSQPENGEEALTVVEQMVDTGVIDVIVLDSVAALTPKKELEGLLEKQDMALQAKLLAKFLRRVTASVSKNNVILIMINQLRDVFNAMAFAPQTQTAGGNALRFYSSVRLQVAKGLKIKQGEEVVGNTLKIKAEKNKVAPPSRQCELDIIYTRGIDLAADTLEWGDKLGVVKKTGTTYFCGEYKLGVGKEASKKFLEENPQVLQYIRDELKKVFKAN